MSTSAVGAVASATNDCELIDRCDVISLTAVMFLELDREWGLDEVIVKQVGSIYLTLVSHIFFHMTEIV